MQEEAVALLVDGVVNVMRHLGMIDDANVRISHESIEIEAEQDGTQRRGYSKSICGRHGRLYTFDEV